MLIGAASVWAAPIDRQTAGDVALNFLSQQWGASSSLKLKSIDALGSDLYLVNFSPVGYAIISGDDTTNPVIGYSTESSLDINRLPGNMAYMMDEAAEAVRINKENIKTPNKRWESFKSGHFALSRAEYNEPVTPLITVAWDQNGLFNQYCPGEGSNKALVGCVAVAMSQAMSVQRYPVKPMGLIQYSTPGYDAITLNYDEEPAYDWNAILNGSNGYKEVARLLYHAGVSVRMEYGPDASGIPSTQPDRIVNALKNTFGYGTDVKLYWRNQTRDFEALLKNELYAGRAVIFNAVDSKNGYGHSFNLDGIDSNGLYHVNWGWGGYGNGYMALDNLGDMRMNMLYDSSHMMITGIGSQNVTFRSIALTDYYVEVNKPAGTVVGMLLVNDAPAASDIKVNLTGPYISASGSYGEVPFTYSDGKILTTRTINKDEGPIYLRVEVATADNSAVLRQSFNIEVEDQKSIDCRTSISYDRITGVMTFTTRYGAELTLKGADGAVVPMVKNEILPIYTINRSAMPNGVNTLEMKFEGQTKAIKIKK